MILMRLASQPTLSGSVFYRGHRPRDRAPGEADFKGGGSKASHVSDLELGLKIGAMGVNGSHADAEIGCDLLAG